MLIYHYTKIEAAVNIIRNGLCFWGFRYDSMNDPTDYIFARDIVMPYLVEQYSDNGIDEYVKFFPYIVSFCKEKDDDVMWRLYNAEVALVIDTDKFPLEEWRKAGDFAENVFCNDVRYCTQETVHTVAKDLYTERYEILENAPLIEYQLYVLPFIKHVAYEVEHEYRLAKIDSEAVIGEYNPQKPEKCDIYEEEFPKDIKCLGSYEGKLRLYKEFVLPKDCLVGLIFHTFDDQIFQTQKCHFKLWLLQNGFSPNNINIEKTASYPVR